MNCWLNHLLEAVQRGEPCVMVTVAAVRGSAPREPGAAMTVTRNGVWGTIGGGNLEFSAIERARRQLDGSEPLTDGGDLCRYVLGTQLGQCCGGVAYVHYQAFSGPPPDWLIELRALQDQGLEAVLVSRHGHAANNHLVVTAAKISAMDDILVDSLNGAAAAARAALEDWPPGRDLLWSRNDGYGPPSDLQRFVLVRPLWVGDFRVVVFGAGHVGRALVRALAPLADQIVWCDGREGEFPADLPDRVRVKTGDPFQVIESMPAGASYLVMTHSHALDMTLCEAILQRGDQGYLGLIGSLSKRRRFEKHLLREGLSERDLKGMVCPIGVPGITGKDPAVIAASVAAQLLQVHETRVREASRTQRADPTGHG